MQKFRQNSKQGFSLIQVSGIIAIAGIALTAALPGGEESSDARKDAITKQRMKAIEKATQNFMATNRRRPCPAAGEADITSDTFGAEVAAPGTCGVADQLSGNVAIGVPPTRTLQLADEYMLDGYGRRFTYIVDKRATKAEDCRDLQSLGTKGGLWIFTDDSDSDASPTDNVMWTLISHGKDGHGAYPANGSTVENRINTFTNDANSILNANALANFTPSVTSKYIKSKYDTDFDDLLWYDESTKNTCCTGLLCNQGFGLIIENTATAPFPVYDLSYDIGDLNGDGVDDIVYTNYKDTDGEIKVILGSRTGWPVSTTTETGLANATYIIDVDYVVTYPAALVVVGDVSGDGNDDILVNSTGWAYLIYDLAGAGTGTHAMSDLVTDGHAIQLQHFGTGAPGPIAIGDVDGDGFNDMLITPYLINRYMYGVYGKSNADWVTEGVSMSLIASYRDSFLMTGSGGVAWTPYPNGLKVGDINNDGYDDIIAGGPSHVYAGKTSGVSYIAGRTRASWPTSGVPPLFNITTEIATGTITRGAFFHSDLAGEGQLGQSIEVADMNNDGYDDIMLVTTHSIYGILGQNTNYAAAGSNALNTMADFRVDTISKRPAGATNLNSIYGVVRAADLNGDSLPDILFSCQNTTLSTANSGTSYIIFNPTIANGWTGNGFENETPLVLFTAGGDGYRNLSGAKGFIIEGNNGDYSHNPRVLDFNKDGLNDIVLGAAGYGGSDTGALYMIWGRKDPTTWYTGYDDTFNTLPKIDAADLVN